MRLYPLPALIGLLVASVPARAHAEGFLELAGGIMTPLGDDQWTNYVDSGPKLALRAGGVGPRAGAMLSVDWTPVNTNDMGFGNAVDISSHRFRVLLSAVGQQKIAPKVFVSARIGGGIDIAYVHVHTDVLGFTSDNSDTDVGLAIEPAVGLWFHTGSMQIGGELALPMSWHDDSNDNNVTRKAYTSTDLDLMFGVRFLQD